VEIDDNLCAITIAKYIFASLNIQNGNISSSPVTVGFIISFWFLTGFISLDQFLSWWNSFDKDRKATINHLATAIIDKFEDGTSR
jgi:hypothetical protein